MMACEGTPGEGSKIGDRVEIVSRPAQVGARMIIACRFCKAEALFGCNLDRPDCTASPPRCTTSFSSSCCPKLLRLQHGARRIDRRLPGAAGRRR